MDEMQPANRQQAETGISPSDSKSGGGSATGYVAVAQAIEPYYVDEFVTLYNADALDVIASLECAVDAVVTDPPYASGSRTEASKSSSGAMMRAGRFADRPLDLDQMTTQGFVWLLRAVARGVYPLLGDGRSFMCFIDWRQWPNLVGALETANLRIQGMVVWDKGHFGLGNGFRAQHELVCHASKGVPSIVDRGVGNVLRHPRVEAVEHPSPKPLALMEQLITTVTGPGDLVFDPFAGSGTTLVAAKATGRRAIGVESDAAYCEVAARRVQETLALGPSTSSPEIDQQEAWAL